MYFYTLGPASFSPRTAGLAFAREITVLGTLEDVSERTLIGIYHAYRLRTARRAR